MKSSNNLVHVGLQTNKLNSITKQSETGNDPKGINGKANHASGSEDGSAKGKAKGIKGGDDIGTYTYLKVSYSLDDNGSSDYVAFSERVLMLWLSRSQFYQCAFSRLWGASKDLVYLLGLCNE
ncbi:unnamed protein product [Lactuca virosa]|uniref:Uncharacterized protein n=1 Tax=Lactuca virosa TaxID=75947 RepID=A0AAU9LTQ6_9ASTR|nr:unnamed protein product [Lactuca virosa]